MICLCAGKINLKQIYSIIFPFGDKVSNYTKKEIIRKQERNPKLEFNNKMHGISLISFTYFLVYNQKSKRKCFRFISRLFQQCCDCINHCLFRCVQMKRRRRRRRRRCDQIEGTTATITKCRRLSNKQKQTKIDSGQISLLISSRLII